MSSKDPTNVLFIDDEAVFAETYILGLRVRGIHAKLVTNVEAARVEFSCGDFPYAAVVIDLWMPAPQEWVNEVNPKGYQTGAYLARELREKYGRKEPILLLSNFADQLKPELIAGLGQVSVFDKREAPPSLLARQILEPRS
jgi:CheY-like chemotaxis protein